MYNCTVTHEQITPSEILSREIRKFEQEEAFEEFREAALQRVRAVYPKIAQLSTPEETTMTIQRVSRSASIEVYLYAVEQLVKSGKSGYTLELDDDKHRPRIEVTIEGGFPLPDRYKAEATEEGIDAGKEDFFNLLGPIEVYSFGKVKVPLIPWHKKIAHLLLDDIIEDGKEMIGYQNTRIPGVQVQLYYPDGSDAPTRSLINYPEKIPLSGDSLR